MMSRSSFRDSSYSLNWGSSSPRDLSVTFRAISVAKRVSRSFCLDFRSVWRSSSSLALSISSSLWAEDSLASRNCSSFGKPTGASAAENSVSSLLSSGSLCSMRFFRDSTWAFAVFHFCCNSLCRSLACFSVLSASETALFKRSSSSSGFLSPYSALRSSFLAASSFFKVSKRSRLSARAVLWVSITASRRFTSLSRSAICFSISALFLTLACHAFRRALSDSSSDGTSVSGMPITPSGRSLVETACLRSVKSARSFSRPSFTSTRAFSAAFLSLTAAVSCFSPSIRFLRVDASASSSFLMVASCSSALLISLVSASIFCSVSSGTGTLPSANGCSVAPQSGQGLPSSSLAR